MKFTIKFLGLTLCTALAGGAVALAAGDVGGTAQDDGHGRQHARRPGAERRFERRGDRREFARSLQISEAQRAQALQTAREAQPAVGAARAEARKIIADARAANPNGDRAAIRAAVREQLRGLRDRVRAQIEPSARALAATLTPEQKQLLEARAKAHGVEFDENRFAARLGRLLARPRAAEFLEHRRAR